MSKSRRPQSPPASTRKAVVPPPVQQKRAAPVAPPVYRPQPTPKVLQRKAAVAGGAEGQAPVAPPVYRPQPAPKVLQPKPAEGQRPLPSRPAPHPATHNILQAKASAPAHARPKSSRDA